MAPEQIRADVVNRQTDVYAASIVLWESLVGRRLYDASNEGALLAKVMEANAAPPSTEALAAAGPLDEEGRHDLGHLDAIVMRGLSKDPAQRFATAREMALELESRLRPATAAEIAAWVEMAAAPALAKRAQLVATLERDEAMSRARGSFADLGAYEGSIPPGAPSTPDAPGAPPVPGAATSQPAGPGFASAAPSELSAVSRISGASQLSQLSKVTFTAGSGAPPSRGTSRSPLLVVLGSTMLGIAVAAGLLAIFFGRPAPGGSSGASTGSPVSSAAATTSAAAAAAAPIPFAPATPSVSALPDGPGMQPPALSPAVPTGNADAGGSSGAAAASEPATPATHHHQHHHHSAAPAAEAAP